MTTYEQGKVYDIIFAGGGTAACAAAGRLARTDPNLSILIVEGGSSNLNDPSVVYPALYLSHLAPGAKATLFYKANKDKAVNDREVEVAAGGVLGGGSSINFMMYSRGRFGDATRVLLLVTETMLTITQRRPLTTIHGRQKVGIVRISCRWQ